jgi:hypothetical protein
MTKSFNSIEISNTQKQKNSEKIRPVLITSLILLSFFLVLYSAIYLTKDEPIPRSRNRKK